MLVPLGILLALRLIPPVVMAEARAKAEALTERPTSRAGLITIVILWLVAASGFAWWILSAA